MFRNVLRVVEKIHFQAFFRLFVWNPIPTVTQERKVVEMFFLGPTCLYYISKTEK